MLKTVTKARSYDPKSSGAISPKKLTPMMASASEGRRLGSAINGRRRTVRELLTQQSHHKAKALGVAVSPP